MKILIIRFSSIGDIVMTTPVLRCIKKQLDATIHFATKKAFTSLVKHNPNVDKVYSLDKNWNEFITPIKKESYDYIIDLHNNIRSKRLSRALNAPSKRYNKLSIHKEALIRFGINNLPNIHVSERGLDTVRFLGVENDHEGMEFTFPPETRMPNEWTTQRFATLALGTTHFTKNMPEDLLEHIIKSVQLPLVLLGGPAEKELGERLEKKYPSKTTNFAGKCSLLESGKFVEQSLFLLAGDTGLLHIAAALKKPTISIWGATIPEFGVFPYYGKYQVPHFIHEVKLKCRPCSKHGGSKCPKKHFNCMKMQDKMAISQHIHELESL